MSYYTILYMGENARNHFKKTKKKLRDLPLALQPREKLLAKGSQNLTDDELLAILLGTGSAKQDVLQVSKNLLKDYPLAKLATTSVAQLSTLAGVGKVKALRIAAAIELGNRIFTPTVLTKIVIRSTAEALTQLRDIMEKRQEYLVVLYLNARHELIQKEVIGKGSLSSMLITAKEVFAPALPTPCASLIVAHNHPSGDPTPSDADIAFTTQIHEAGNIMGIVMLDHLIVTSSGYFSFRENKLGVRG